MKDPAILFYTADFLTGTLTMSDDQVGKYIRLLCLQHQKGRLTEKDMLFICKSYDKDIFDKFTQNGDGRYFNERMDREIDRRLKYSESRSSNRKAKENKEEKEDKISKTYDKHMETETITETIIKNLNINLQYIEIVNTWLDYKKKKKQSYKDEKSIQCMIKNLCKLSNNDVIIATEIVEKSMANNWNGLFELNKNSFEPKKYLDLRTYDPFAHEDSQ